MSPIPPNKHEHFQPEPVSQDTATDSQPEEVTIANPETTDTAGGWDPNYYNVNYNSVTYQQLNQESTEPLPTDEIGSSGSSDNDDDEENGDCQLTEIDPDVEFEILAESRRLDKFTQKVLEDFKGIFIEFFVEVSFVFRQLLSRLFIW